MGTRCNIAVLLRPQDRRTIRFNKKLIPVISEVPAWQKREAGLPTFEGIPYRTADLSGVPEGMAIRIYCQFDGYVKGGVGQTLAEYYDSPEAALNLAAGGNLETLCTYTDKDGTIRGGYRNWAMSGRDRGQARFIPQDRLFRFEKPAETVEDGLYMYLYKDGQWWVHNKKIKYAAAENPNIKELQDLPFWIPVREYIEKDIDRIID